MIEISSDGNGVKAGRFHNQARAYKIETPTPIKIVVRYDMRRLDIVIIETFKLRKKFTITI